MPKKPDKPERNYAVGDSIKVNLHTGRIVDATVRAVVNRGDRVKLQVDYGENQTALIWVWQVVK